ncbi:DUF3221 domain-containing protein [Fredinandcohnia humi]
MIYITYNEANKFKVGDKIKVWLEGGINESYPPIARASKIVLINE